MHEPGPLIFYYRNGCHLCEELASMIHRGWPAVMQELQWADVDTRSDWRERYGLRIPVLARGEQVLCELAPDAGCLQEHFGPPNIPV